MNASYRALHYKAPGTDLTIELPEGHIWVSAGSYNEKGTLFIANMPTEEVFTAPKRDGINGTVQQHETAQLRRQSDRKHQHHVQGRQDRRFLRG